MKKEKEGLGMLFESRRIISNYEDKLVRGFQLITSIEVSNGVD